MSILSWFTRKPPAPSARSLEPSGLLNSDATVPMVHGRDGRQMPEAPPADHAANRKNERMERRELLYTVVRDAMVRAGVLSASYKFKVLSLDQRGSQFLVMMDLAHEFGGDTGRLSEIEALIAQTAKSRHDIAVTAVYWRINDHVAVGMPQRAAEPRPAAPQAVATVATVAAAAPHQPPPGVPRPTTAAAAPPLPLPLPLARPVQTRTPRPILGPARAPFDPVAADEVEAFKKALGAAERPGLRSPVSAPARKVAVRKISPDDFADTEMPARSPDLGVTQYGEL